MRVSSLFFSDHSHVRAVHSSPTRRSSDLRGLRMAEEEVSRVVAMAWGVAAAPQRGPKRELSHERIVEAAMEIADAEGRSEEHTSELQSRGHVVCRLLLEKKKPAQTSNKAD